MTSEKVYNDLFWKKKPPLDLSFYQRSAEVVAPALLGKFFVKRIGNIWCVAKITETEACLGENDLASHSARGQTRRNASMFLAGGSTYVYLVYGIHHCFNIVTGMESCGEAVLIRAAVPCCGVDVLMQNRKTSKEKGLLQGPGNFAKAFALNKLDDSLSLSGTSMKVVDDGPVTEKIIASTRIGITRSEDLKLRFNIKASMKHVR